MSLIDELLSDETLGAYIASLKAIPSSGGRFEIMVNDELIYSKKATGRHAQPGEIYKLLQAYLDSNH